MGSLVTCNLFNIEKCCCCPCKAQCEKSNSKEITVNVNQPNKTVEQRLYYKDPNYEATITRNMEINNNNEIVKEVTEANIRKNPNPVVFFLIGDKTNDCD